MDHKILFSEIPTINYGTAGMNLTTKYSAWLHRAKVSNQHHMRVTEAWKAAQARAIASRDLARNCYLAETLALRGSVFTVFLYERTHQMHRFSVDWASDNATFLRSFSLRASSRTSGIVSSIDTAASFITLPPAS